MADQTQWYVRKGDKVQGPFTSQQLKQLANDSRIGPDTHVRRSQDDRWIAARKIKGLFATQSVSGVITVSKPQPPAIVESHPFPPRPLQNTNVPTQPMAIAVRVPCPFCAEEIAETAIKCRHCNEFLDGRPREQPQPAQQIIAMAPAPVQQPNVNVSVSQQTIVGALRRRWSPLLAMFLSFLIPGLGQLYKGQPINGFVWFVVVLIGYFAFVVPGLILHLFCIIGSGMGDPYR